MIHPITENTKSIIKLNNINANKGKNKLWKFIINSELKIATKTSIEDKPINRFCNKKQYFLKYIDLNVQVVVSIPSEFSKINLDPMDIASAILFQNAKPVKYPLY